MMATSSTGAVFFLGTRAHYQVLQPPDANSYDIKNGNEPSETYQNPPHLQEIWPKSAKDGETRNTGNCLKRECGNWMTCGRNENESVEIECNDNCRRHGDFEFGGGVTRRLKKNKKQFGSNEQILNGNEDTIDIDPTALNNINERNAPKTKTNSRRCASLRAFLASLKSKRKRKLSSDELSYVETLENVLDMCTYKDSCRCLDCQSRYFECDETDSEMSDSEYSTPEPHVAASVQDATRSPTPEDEDEEVFVDVVPSDNTSTDLLLEEPKEKMLISPADNCALSEEEIDEMQLEMAAGTPVVLDYLLNHPIACVIQ